MWTCSKCENQNSDNRNKCDICGTDKPQSVSGYRNQTSRTINEVGTKEIQGYIYSRSAAVTNDSKVQRRNRLFLLVKSILSAIYISASIYVVLFPTEGGGELLVVAWAIVAMIPLIITLLLRKKNRIGDIIVIIYAILISITSHIIIPYYYILLTFNTYEIQYTIEDVFGVCLIIVSIISIAFNREKQSIRNR